MFFQTHISATRSGVGVGLIYNFDVLFSFTFLDKLLCRFIEGFFCFLLFHYAPRLKITNAENKKNPAGLIALRDEKMCIA